MRSIIYSRAISHSRSGVPTPTISRARVLWPSQKRFEALRLFQTRAANHQTLHEAISTVQTPQYNSFAGAQSFLEKKDSTFVEGVHVSVKGETLTVNFHDSSYSFHAQWLYDAQVGDVPSKEAAEAYSQPCPAAQVWNVRVTGQGIRTTLEVTWNTGRTSQLPAPWLYVYAPMVAECHHLIKTRNKHTPRGWLVKTLAIPEFSYSDLFPRDSTSVDFRKTLDQVYSTILNESSLGIMKIVDLPAPIVDNERNGQNALVTQILRQLFGSVFIHPRRGGDLTFNIASHHPKDVKKGAILPNYNTSKTLLGHTDQSHYILPTRVNSLYNLEGESENTFVSCEAAFATLCEEAPHLVEHLCQAPVAIGRVAHWYHPSLYQGNIDTTVTMQPGFPDRIWRFRWHPHLTGSLLSPYEKFPAALAAHKKFQEILRRSTHELKVTLKPGDLYIWDNFRVLHGRERVLKMPRTSVGQSVSPQVASDTYREFKLVELMRHFDEKWLVHMPQAQLNELEEVVLKWTT